MSVNKQEEDDAAIASCADADNDNDADNDDGNDNLIPQFLSFTGTSDNEVARQYLQMSDNILENAVTLFWAADTATTTTTTTTTTTASTTSPTMNNDDDNGDDGEGEGGGNVDRVDGVANSTGICGRIENGAAMAVEEEAEVVVDETIQLTTTENDIEGEDDQISTNDNSRSITCDDEIMPSNNAEEEGSEHFSEPDYEYLLSNEDEDDGAGAVVDEDNSSEEMVYSSPDYDYLGLESVYEEEDEEEGNVSEHSQEVAALTTTLIQDAVSDNPMPANDLNSIYPTKGHKVDLQPVTTDDDEEVEDSGEEYILGTMMVRVLQARHVKSNPYNEGGNLISNLLSNHRRNRQQRTTPSPASAGGHGTPTTIYSGNNQQIYATLTYRNQSQSTSMAMEHNGNGDYYWSRSDQSYFDVMCPAFPLKMNQMIHPKSPSLKAKQTTFTASAATYPQKNASRAKSNNYQQHHHPSPLLELSLYSKKNNSQGMHNKQGKWNPYQKGGDMLPETNDDYLVGKCYINVLRILCGRTPYFDEWCTIHSDDDNTNNNRNKNRDAPETMAGRVRIVIEYEPTDPPPRPGDMCVFANVYPIVDEFYPIPPFSMIRTNNHRWSSSSSSKAVLCRPKTFCVEEVVGDHVVLSYQTPVENWKCTFEVHRYLLLCVERHQAAVEKYREQVLDLCDNLVQSPVVDVLTKTVSTLPDEGLVHVAEELVVGSLGLLGRWWENGVDGMIEDVVDGINLDGRHSQFFDDEEEAEEDVAADNAVNDIVQNPSALQKNAINLPEKVWNDERKALPGMPCCPITGVPMIEPVVAADGHTYERNAIARWLQTSSRSPLTGEIFAHRELVPNYLLLSSLGNERGGKEKVDKANPALLDVL